MLFTQFRDEDDFRTRFIRPLLNRLGFWGVALKHGTQEFGKDFVFSEVHRFGGLRHYAAQVKHEEKINQGIKVDQLLTQIRQAFSTPFTLPDSPRERYVSAVYVFNSGGLTDNAQTQILTQLRRENFGDNVHLLDGDSLDSLNRWATYQEDRHVRQRFSGLQLQMRLNRGIWLGIQTAASRGAFSEVRGSFLHGIEEFLSSPVHPDLIDLEPLVFIWQKARIVDSIVSANRAKNFFVGTAHKNEAKLLVQLTQELIEKAMYLETLIDRALNRLNPL